MPNSTLHPDTPHTSYCLTALEHEGRVLTMLRHRKPQIAEAGRVMIYASKGGNWFACIHAAQAAITLLKAAGMAYTAGQIERVIEVGNEKIARPYFAEMARMEAAQAA
jgi:hypothetical protein